MSLSEWAFAASYDLLNTGVEGRLRAYREQTAGRAQGRVLEIGGGTGANLAYYPPSVSLTVVEPNPHMRRRLRRRAARLDRQVVLVSEVGERLPFPDESFDSVVTTLVLCMVEDLDQVVQETRRVLRPGGVFYFYEHVVAEGPWLRRLQDRLNPAWRFLTTGCNLNRDIAGAIGAAGFRQVDIRSFDLRFAWLPAIPNIVGSAVT